MRWLPFERMSTKPPANSLRSASAAVRRGSLGMRDLQRRRENRLATQPPQFSRLQGFQVKLRCLSQICQRLLHCFALRVAALEFRAIGKGAVLVLFDDGCELASHWCESNSPKANKQAGGDRALP